MHTEHFSSNQETRTDIFWHVHIELPPVHSNPLYFFVQRRSVTDLFEDVSSRALVIKVKKLVNFHRIQQTSEPIGMLRTTSTFNRGVGDEKNKEKLDGHLGTKITRETSVSTREA